MDRLSILTMKCWALTHRGSDAASALIVKQTQVQELVAALTQAKRGFSSINNKITVHKVETVSDDFGEAAFGLFSTNLLLWEAQELLYNRDITTFAVQRASRVYIFFFRGKIFLVTLSSKLAILIGGGWWMTSDD